MKRALATIAACVLLAACTKTSDLATTSNGPGGASSGPRPIAAMLDDLVGRCVRPPWHPLLRVARKP